MHVIIIFIFIILILLFYYFICNYIINSNSHFEYMIDIPYKSNYKISEEQNIKNSNILNYNTNEESLNNNKLNYVTKQEFVNKPNNINIKNNVNVEIDNNKIQNETNKYGIKTETNSQIHNINHNNYDDEDDDDDDEYDDDDDDDDYIIYDSTHDSNKNKEIRDIRTSESIDINKNNNIEMENNINNPYSNKKYYYNNIGTIMSGQDFIGTNIKIADNDEVAQYLMPTNNYTLDDGKDGAFLLHNNLCSKSCCSEQYPVPFKLQYDKYVCQNKNELVPSNYTCNNSMQDSGCLCLTKSQGSFLYNRGGNA